jgi:hypothetical protein
MMVLAGLDKKFTGCMELCQRDNWHLTDYRSCFYDFIGRGVRLGERKRMVPLGRLITTGMVIIFQVW